MREVLHATGSNSMRVDEGRKGLICSSRDINKGTYRSGEGGEEPAYGRCDPRFELRLLCRTSVLVGTEKEKEKVRRR